MTYARPFLSFPQTLLLADQPKIQANIASPYSHINFLICINLHVHLYA